MSSTKDRQELPMQVGSTSPWSVTPARPSEHHAIRQFLITARRGFSAAEYQSQLDDPHYEPQDRLLCRVRDVLVGHVHLLRRELRLGEVALPISMVADFLVVSELRCRGIGSEMLVQAEKEMLADGTLVALTRTGNPQFLLRRGWTPWTRHSYSTASAREILAQLRGARGARGDEDGSQLTVRLYRQIEMGGLMRLYADQSRGAYGPLVRTEAYWNWLLIRHGYDRIYVAMHGPRRHDLDRGAEAMVGYAVVRQGRILELVSCRKHPEAEEALMARICSDAIEQDGQFVQFDAPVEHPLHLQIARAGGELGYHEAVRGEVCLAKILDWPGTIQRLGSLFSQRLVAAGRGPSAELAIGIDSDRYSLQVQPTGAELVAGGKPRGGLSGSKANWTQLLLGHLDLTTAIAAGRFASTSRAATELATVLFPRLPLWRPPWDELPAR